MFTSKYLSHFLRDNFLPNSLLANSISCNCASVGLFDIFAKSRFDKDTLADTMYGYIFDCDLLIIDDLGTELTNSFIASQLFLCLNERLLKKRSTIISTNLSLESIVEIYSERIFSRITSNYTMLRLTGDDIRIKKKLMNMEEQTCYIEKNEI